MTVGQRKITIEPLRESDREMWEALSRGYHEFYGRALSRRTYEYTWQQLIDAKSFYGLGGHLNGNLVGIAHFLYHPRVWFGQSCYLQDLFVDERARRLGVGRALIEAVTKEAGELGCSRVYWHTRENNSRARLLYDSVAGFDGFIRYEIDARR